MPICQFSEHQIADSDCILPGLSDLSTSYLFATINRKLHVLSRVSKYINLKNLCILLGSFIYFRIQLIPFDLDDTKGDSTITLIIFTFIPLQRLLEVF